MDNNYFTGQTNYNDMEGIKPRITKKTIVICIVVFFVLIGVASIVFVATKEPEQNLENQEAVVEFVGENSRVADIQFLLDNGLTLEKYTSVCSAIDKALNKVDSESKYFSYVYDSFKQDKSQSNQNSTLTEEERVAILAAVSGNDHTTEKYGPEKSSADAHLEKEQLPVMSFTLASDTGKTYNVKFDSSQRADNMKVRVTDSDGNEIK